MRLEHEDARQPAHPVNVGKAFLWGSHRGTLRYNIRLPATRQIGPMPMLGLWGVLCMAMILLASLTGYGYSYGGRSFIAALATFGMLLAGMLIFAARGVADRVALSREASLGRMSPLTLSGQFATESLFGFPVREAPILPKDSLVPTLTDGTSASPRDAARNRNRILPLLRERYAT